MALQVMVGEGGGIRGIWGGCIYTPQFANHPD